MIGAWFIVIAICVIFFIYSKSDEVGLNALSFGFYTFFIGGLIVLVTNIFFYTLNGTPTSFDRDMQAISTGSQTSGSFFLGSGGFGEDAVYYYYAKDSGGYRMFDVDADRAVIMEDAEPGTAHVTIPCTAYNPPLWASWPFSFSNYENCGEWEGDYVFHVPPDSVAYNVDLSLPD